MIKVKIKIKPNGRPSSAVQGEFSGTGTGFCVLKGVNALRFPRFSGPPMTILYPFNLK